MIMPNGFDYIMRIRKLTNDLIIMPNTEYYRKLLYIDNVCLKGTENLGTDELVLKAIQNIKK